MIGLQAGLEKMSRLGTRRPKAADGETHGGALGRGWRLLPRALQYLRPYRALAATSIGLTVVLSIVALAEPWPLAFIVDTVLSDRPPPGWI